MGHRANFVVIKNDAAEAYYDHWAGYGAAFGLADGPGPAIESLKDFEPTNELLDWAFAEGGFLIDFDQKLVIVFGELDDLSDELAEYEDNDDFEEDDGRDEADSYVNRYTHYFTEIAPHWESWRLRYDDRGVDAFAEHLNSRNILSINVQKPAHPDDAEQFEFQA